MFHLLMPAFVFLVFMVCVPTAYSTLHAQSAYPFATPAFRDAALQDVQYAQYDGKHLYCRCGRQLAAFEKIKKQANMAAIPLPRAYNALRYSVFLNWTNPLSTTGETGADRIWNGSNTITLVVDSAQMHTLTLNALQLRIDSVSITNPAGRPLQTAPMQYSPATEEVSIPLLTTARKGDTLTVLLHYTHTGMDNNAGGFYLYRKGRYGGTTLPRTAGSSIRDSVFTVERIAYTMSEPRDARRWMPCNDVPTDKVLCDIALQVPANFTAVANGTLVSVKGISDRTGTVISKIFYWRHQHPIASYLMVAVASVFKQSSQWYTRVSNPKDSVEIAQYYWAVDDTTNVTDGSCYNLTNTMSSAPQTMAAYSRWFGEYPFERLGFASLQPFQFGGMEHQTMITYNRSWLRGIAWGVAHEIMHHWFGNLVSPASWNDIWLNEGGGTYGETLWYESWGGDAWAMPVQLRIRNDYLNSSNNKGSIYIPNGDQADQNTIFNGAMSYAKASWVYFMLRRMLGDSTFFRAMRLHFSRFAYQSASTDDFRRSLEIAVPAPPVPFATFFDQWIYKARHPIYDVFWRTDHAVNGATSGSASGVETTVTLRQLQTGDNVPSVFVMPVELTFLGANGEKEARSILNTERSQQARFTLPFAPIRVVVNERNSILAERTNRAAGLQQADSLANRFATRLYPQPLAGSDALTVEFTLAQPDDVRIEIWDMLGKQVATVFAGTLPKGTHYLPWSDTGQVAQGAYMLRTSTRAGTEVQRFMVLR